MENTAPIPKNRFEDLLGRLPLTWICLGFLAGILLAVWIPLPWWIWLIAAQVWIMLALMIRFVVPHLPIKFPTGILLIVLAFSGAALGSLRYQVNAPTAADSTVSRYNDLEQEVVITGVIIAPPDVRDDHVNVRVQVSAVDSGNGDLPITGLILARVYEDDLHYGDTIRLRGNLSTPFETEGFSYRDILARQGIHSYMVYGKVTRLPVDPAGKAILRLIYSFKENALARLQQIFHNPEAALLGGILLGDDNGLPADIQQDFNNTGTTHIIAISGFNITIITSFFVIIFNDLLGKRRGSIPAIICIVVYVVLVGASPSVVRAAIMAGLSMFARFLGRRQAGLNILSFSAAVMTAIDPNILWDVGFQLSFFSTLGILLYVQPAQDWFTARLTRHVKPETANKIARPIIDFFFITLAAQLTTLPIIAWHFKTIPLVSLLANPLILPVQPLVMILGGLALLVSYIYIPLGQLFAWGAWPFVAYTIRIVEACATLPHGTIHLREFSVIFVVIYYSILFAFTFSQGRTRQALKTVFTPATVLVTLVALVFLAWNAAFLAPQGTLRITFLPARSAEAVLIQTPSGRNILINGGPSAADLSTALGRRMTPFDARLDWLVIAATGQEQLEALPRTLEIIPADQVLWSGNTEASYASSELAAFLAQRTVPVTMATPGMELDLGSGARLVVMDVTLRGAILMVEWEGFRCLLPFGQNFDHLENSAWGKEIGPVSVLLLSDAGMRQTNPVEWVDNLRPQVLILSIEAGSDSWLPDNTMMQTIRDMSLLRTDRNGWITIATDGAKMWVDVEKR